MNTRAFKVDGCENEFLENKGIGTLNIHRIIREEAPNEEFEASYYNYLTTALLIINECTVTFIKADGSLREMPISYSRLKQHMEETPSEPRYKQAAETRKKNHPNLLSVFDVESETIKSINMKTLKEIKYDGMVVTFTESNAVDE